MALVPTALDDLISTTEAADDLGCGVSTVSMWAARGYLTPSGLDPRGRPLYKRIDVLRAERATRQRSLGRRSR